MEHQMLQAFYEALRSWQLIGERIENEDKAREALWKGGG